MPQILRICTWKIHGRIHSKSLPLLIFPLRRITSMIFSSHIWGGELWFVKTCVKIKVFSLEGATGSLLAFGSDILAPLQQYRKYGSGCWTFPAWYHKMNTQLCRLMFKTCQFSLMSLSSVSLSEPTEKGTFPFGTRSAFFIRNCTTFWSTKHYVRDAKRLKAPRSWFHSCPPFLFPCCGTIGHLLPP